MNLHTKLQELEALRLLLSFEQRETIRAMYVRKIEDRRKEIIHFLN